jgi:hypothetical protein
MVVMLSRRAALGAPFLLSSVTAQAQVESPPAARLMC